MRINTERTDLDTKSFKYLCYKDTMVDPVVRVEEGELKGKVETDGEKTFYSFMGIPYAKPPLGDLRFKVYRLQDCVQYKILKLYTYFIRHRKNQSHGQVSEMLPKNHQSVTLGIILHKI